MSLHEFLWNAMHDDEAEAIHEWTGVERRLRDRRRSLPAETPTRLGGDTGERITQRKEAS